MDNGELKDQLIGQTLVDTYLVGEQLGAGGMGTLYKARHLKLGQDVALKFVQRKLRADIKTLKRLRREAQVLSGLHHPNIIAVRAFHIEDNSDAFLVMEFLEGVTLEQYVNEHGPLELAKFNMIFRQISDALTYAHLQGIIHRDLKPANIMLIGAADGPLQVKLLDFGLAKLADGPQSQKLTATGTLVGTINYISPEQCSGGQLDQRADLYSLACVMFDSLTGKIPFDEPSGLMVIRKHMEESLPPLPEPLPRALSNILQRCTAVNPEDRLSSVEEMWNAIESRTPVMITVVKKPPRTIKTWRTPGAIGGLALLACIGVLAVPFAADTFRKMQIEKVQKHALDQTFQIVRSAPPGAVDIAMDNLEKITDVSNDDLEQLATICFQRAQQTSDSNSRRIFCDSLLTPRTRQVHSLMSTGHGDDAIRVLGQTILQLQSLNMAALAHSILHKELEAAHFSNRTFYYKTRLILLDVHSFRKQYSDLLILDRFDAAWATARRMIDHFRNGEATDAPGAIPGDKKPPASMIALINEAASEMIGEAKRQKDYGKVQQTAEEWLLYMDRPNWGSAADVVAMKAARDNASKLGAH